MNQFQQLFVLYSKDFLVPSYIFYFFIYDMEEMNRVSEEDIETLVRLNFANDGKATSYIKK